MNLGPLGRRQFLQSATSSIIAAATGGESLRQAAGVTPSPQKALPWPKTIGSPVLDSLPPVIENSRAVHTSVEKLSEVNVDGVEPMTSVTPMEMKKRPDVVNYGEIPDDIIRNAPATDDHFFLVPKVVE